MRHRAVGTVLSLLLTAGPILAAEPTGMADLLPQVEAIARQQPTVGHWVGLAEFHRTLGQSSASVEDLAKANRAPGGQEQASALADLACWRALPVATSQLTDFRRQVGELRKVGGGWLPVYELFLAWLAQDRQALLAVANRGDRLPQQFPTVWAESAHIDLLRELGFSLVEARLEVISRRNFDSLHALRDLDQGLSREIDFLRTAGRPDDARTLETARDRLRQAYRAASRQLVERLFALNLLERTQERDQLLARAKALPYLADPQALATLLERLDGDEAGTMIVGPLLDSEVRFIEAPPDLDKMKLRKTTLNVQAARKFEDGEVTRYQGEVHLGLGRYQIGCDSLTVVRSPGSPPSLSFVATGNLKLQGIPGWKDGLRADRCSFSGDIGRLVFGGDVRFLGVGHTVKLRACSLTLGGAVGDRRSLLDDFREAIGLAQKLDLLPRITAVYADDELPTEVRYLLALNLLRPHLTWHAAYAPPRPEMAYQKVEAKEWAIEHLGRAKRTWSAWEGAHHGEPWLLDADTLKKVEEELKQARAERAKLVRDSKDQKHEEVEEGTYFWRLRDPKHADVARALRLLEGCQGDDRALEWLLDLRRNNTILTFDVTGGYAPGKDAPIVMDARNADRVSFKLYRAHDTETLLRVTDRIGVGFLFRDYALQGPEAALPLRERMQHAREHHASKASALKVPVLEAKDLVSEWENKVGDLKVLPFILNEQYWADEEQGPDSLLFDDRCSAHRARIEKTYHPQRNELSSWQCERVVTVPGKALTAGAYVLVAEANGQIAYAPIVVDPLSLTLGRCRDGVFALVSERDGANAVAGASVSSRGQLAQAVTDAGGATFLRVFAAGDRAIIAEKDGRFAIGGFGEVFEGVYTSLIEKSFLMERDHLEGRLRRLDTSAQVFADQHVIAAYTDRPTYRPGQDVQFKLIVRKLAAAKPPDKPGPQVFRENDFEIASRLVLPEKGDAAHFEVVAPNGRIVGTGDLKLNDFGTAAGQVRLGDEVPTGAYSLRVHLAGVARVMPDVFAVKYYRRPSFELTADLPAKTKETELAFTLSAQYYFGKPVLEGVVSARLVQADVSRPRSRVEARTNAEGNARLTLPLPAELPGGNYFVVCEATDQSGRTVSKTLALQLDRPNPEKPKIGLGSLPRFIPAEKLFEVATSAKEVVADRYHGKKETNLLFKFDVKDGKATVRLPAGWYTLSAGAEKVDVFAYGGKEYPQPLGAEDDDDNKSLSGWVDLTDYRDEEDDSPRHRFRQPNEPVLALFDRQHAAVGDKVRVLIYVPYQRARLLFTIEGRTVMDYITTWTTEESGCYHVVEVPVKQRYVPNFFLRARLLAGLQPDRDLGPREGRGKAKQRLEDEDIGDDPSWCRIDVLGPRERAGEDRLKIEVETDQREYRPGGTVGVRLRITDLQGRPREAELSLGAVDESVYTFGEDRVGRLARFFSDPYPPQRFYPKAWRDARGDRWTDKAREEKIDVQQKAMQMAKEGGALNIEHLVELNPLPGEVGVLPLGEMPIASLALGHLRTDFRETATWRPQLRTDADGVARTTFKLPDSLTRYRLTAVGLTKQTEIGVGRANLRTTLPLAVQLFMPRFAVEKDQLTAIGLVHNNGPAARVCTVTWEVEGAKVEGLAGAGTDLDDWKTETVEGKTIGRGKVKVPAGGSARVALAILTDRAGPAHLVFRAADAADADAEARDLPVKPVGRSREVHLDGHFAGERRIELPDGFLAQDLQICLARGEVARSLDGIGYLVDYPYGCVEQTMSRFLPAVMVKEATRHAPVALPQEVSEKLPTVLNRGLARLYHFQHADGGWGWWEHDKTDDRMTAYVVYGLARCRLSGTEVDSAVLAKSCAYLKKQLAEGKLEQPLAAEALPVLALAGHTDNLEVLGRGWLDKVDSPAVLCNLALACRSAGRLETSQRLWAKAQSWKPQTPEEIALKLSAQVEFGASFADCEASAKQLLAARTGLIWNNTRATSAAIDALSRMLGYAIANVQRKIQVKVDGQTVLDLKDEADLKKLVYRLQLPVSRLPTKEAVVIELVADADGEIAYTVAATGVQRQDELAPIGDRIKMLRRLETLGGKPFEGALRVGQVVAVRLTVDLADGQDYLLVEDSRPAGCEFAGDQLEEPTSRKPQAANVEFRDDRVCAFFGHLAAGRHELVYYLRAETPGLSRVLPGCVYPMYAPHIRGETGSDRLEVRP